LKTAVVSVFPACGKSYTYNHFRDKYSMLDSDSSQFSWIKDADGNNTKERNPDFLHMVFFCHLYYHSLSKRR